MTSNSEGKAPQAGNPPPEGQDSRDRPSSPDSAHAGAKPAAVSHHWYAWNFFGDPLSPGAAGAMSGQLARNWWAIGLRGVLAILFGAAAVLWPGITMTTLVLLFAFYMLADGILGIFAGMRAARRQERWGMLILEGAADLVAGGIALVWPMVTILAFVILLGAWAIVTGSLLFSAALRLQQAHGRLWMALGGLVSAAWGVLLLLFPFMGALALAWALGIYALVFGGLLTGLALRLRSRWNEGRVSGTPYPQGG